MHNSINCTRWRQVVLQPLTRSLLTLLPLLASLIALVLPAPARADPPGRIGRVAWLSAPGSLTLEHRGSGETFRAPLNQPLTSGDVVRTDANARAEIQIGSTTLRLAEDTTLELTRVDDKRVSVFLRDGQSIVKLTSPETLREFELNTPDGRVGALEPGIFRVDADNGGSRATSYAGTLRFTANDAEFDLRAGERADVWFDGQTRYRLSTPVSDDFMHWSAARDQRPLASASSRYVSPEMTGADELDAYGDWSESPEYGPLWTPRAVAIDWAPYRSGHWVWVAPWGWSWVGHEPWGFAPFHYGRWVHHRGRWGWVPGAYLARPVYAPAMVAWAPAPGVTLSFSFGSPSTAGWFPLAPREVYVPFYRSSPEYVRRVNHTHVTHIDNVELIIRNPHEAGRDMRHIHRDLTRTMPPRSFVRDAPPDRLRPSTPAPREFHRDDDRRREGQRQEVRENRRERPPENRPQARPQAPAKPRHADMAFFEPSQPARAPARTVQREARQAEQRAPANIERHPHMPRRSPAEDDPRKRHPRPDGSERH